MGVDVKNTLRFDGIRSNEATLDSLGSFYHSWQYNTTMDNLAETWAGYFSQATKYKLTYDVNRHYAKMVVEMETNHSNYDDVSF